MPSLERYLDFAECLAEQVVSAWGINKETKNPMTHEFESLAHKALEYQNKQHAVDSHREFNNLTTKGEKELAAAKLEFATAYKIFDDLFKDK
jgi:hypothetical protein